MKKLLVLFLVLLALPAFAQENKKAPAASGPNPEKMAVLKKIKEQGENLEYHYLGRRFGMDAWLITGKGVMQIVHTAPNGLSAVVGGVLVGPDGQEISSAMQREFTEKNPELAQKLLETAREKPDNAPAEAAAPQNKSDQVWNDLSKLGLVTYAVTDIDAPVPIVYAMLDPEQEESKIAFRKLLPLAEEGKIVLHAVPLATTSGAALAPIAAVLAAKDSVDQWKKFLGGTPPQMPDTIDPMGAEKLNANVTFAQGLKLKGVPFFFYRKPEAGGWGKVQVLKGMPKNWEIFLKSIEIQAN
jgi:hypothetical protein